VRDAITAIHNLETLLKSPRVGAKVLSDVLPELWGGTASLRAAFANAAEVAKSDDARAARRALADLALSRVDHLERAMRVSTGELDTRARLTLHQVVTHVRVDLDACTELLDLAERSEHTHPTELALDQLALVALRGTPREGEPEIAVRLADGSGDCVLRADPHVFKRLIVFAVARVHAAGAASVTIRVGCDAERAFITVGPTHVSEITLATTAMRLVRRVEPTDLVVDSAARSASIDMVVDGTITLSAPRVH
jgi:hypothetical protein